MIEKWADIPGYEGIYKVSDIGNVKAMERKSKGRREGFYVTKKERLLKLRLTNHGYLTVGFCVDRKRETFLVHRLVMLAFSNKIEGKDFVNHIDGDKTNNNLSNLEWCTPLENANHALAIGLKKTVLGSNKYEIIKDYENGMFYTEIKKKYKVCMGAVRKMLIKEGVALRKRGESQIKYKVDKELYKFLLEKGMSIVDISKEMNIPVGILRGFKSRAKKKGLW